MKIKIFLRVFGILFLISGIALGGYAVYDYFLNENKSSLNNVIIFGVVGVALLIFGFVLLMIAKHYGLKRCLKCGHKLYGCAYKWTLLQLGMSKTRSNDFASQVAEYEIEATCPKCGKTRTYHQDFIAADLYGTQVNTQKKIEDWCKDMFGH